MSSQEPNTAEIESGDSGAVEVVVADDWDRGVFDGGEVEGDEVAWEEIEDLHALIGWEEGQEDRGVKEVCYGADGDRGCGGVGCAGVVLDSAAEGNSFDFEAWRWRRERGGT